MGRLRKFVLFCVLLFSGITSMAQETFRVFLVGDAGDHKMAGETLVNLRKELLAHPESAVIFLGDNSYKNVIWSVIPFGYKGFDSSQNTIDKVNSQLRLLDQYHGYAYFTPGNHDWWNRATYKKGKPKLAMEQSFIEKNLKLNPTIANPDNVFLPANGDYGPVSVVLNNGKLRIVFIDTYRIIQTGIRKQAIPEDERLFYDRLDSVIKLGYSLQQKVMVVAHHPIHSVGPFNQDIHHPYLFRRIKASLTSFPSYRTMIGRIEKILVKYPGIYYASGHIHALQYFYTKDSVHYIVSGAGSKEHEMSQKEINLYNAFQDPNAFLLWDTGGFFEVEFTEVAEHTFMYYGEGAIKCDLPN